MYMYADRHTNKFDINVSGFHSKFNVSPITNSESFIIFFFYSFSPHYNVIVLGKCIYTKGIPTSYEKSFYFLYPFIYFLRKRGKICGFLSWFFIDGSVVF